MKICTFNLRKNCDKGLQSFRKRFPLIKVFFEKEAPDITGFQEVMPGPLKKLARNLKDYEFYGVGRMAGNKEESVPIAWKKDKFTCLDKGTFWLSDTPDVPGSKAFDCYWPRICSWVKLQSEEGVLLVYNVHLDHRSEPARQLGTKLVKEHMAKNVISDKAGLMIMGDFNVFPDSDVVAKMAEPFVSADDVNVALKDITENLEYSYQGYGLEARKEKIDYIYVSEGLKAEDPSYLYEYINEKGTYISDHFPVLVNVEKA